jgi:hypothetical protein
MPSYGDSLYFHGVSGTFFPVSLPGSPHSAGSVFYSFTMVMTVDDNWLDTYPSGGATFVPGSYNLPPDSLGQMGLIKTVSYDYTLNRWTFQDDGIKITDNPFDPDGAKFDIVLSAGGAALGRPVSVALQTSHIIDEDSIVASNPPFGTDPPNAPSGVIVTAIDTSGFGLNVIWTDNSTDEDGFFIQRSNDGGSSWTGTAVTGADVESYDSLDRDTTIAWSFRVKAFNATGVSDWAVGDYDPAGGGVPDSITPDNGPTTGGTTVLVTWADQEPGATVTVAGSSVTLAGDNTFITPPHAVGAVIVRVTNTDTTFIEFTFNYWNAPVIVPNNGPIEGTQSVTISRGYTPTVDDGSDFIDGASIFFGGVAATDVVRVDAGHYNCKTPAHAAGIVDMQFNDIDARLLNMDLPNAYFFGSGTGAPVITISPNKVAHGPLPSTVSLAATVSSSILPDYHWSQVKGPELATIVSPNALATNITFSTYTPGKYVFRFTASDPTNVYAPIGRETTVIINAMAPPIIKIS